jgi:hypothetical protein
LHSAEDGLAYLSVRHSKSRDQDSDVFITSNYLAALQDTPAKAYPQLYGFIDLRLFNFRGRLWAAAHRLEETGRTAMYLLLVQEGQAARLECSAPEGGDRMRDEKNWVPIPHDTGLYWIHTLSPFRLLRCQVPAGENLPSSIECEDVDAGSRWQLEGNGRGSSVARAVAGGLLLATHERTRQQPPSYSQGLVYLAAEPPFAALAQSEQFALVGSDFEAQQALGASRGSFHFLNDLCCVGEDIFFCVGVADTDAVIVSASEAEVMAQLRSAP